MIDVQQLQNNRSKLFDALYLVGQGKKQEGIKALMDMATLPVPVVDYVNETLTVKTVGELTADDFQLIADEESMLLVEDMTRDMYQQWERNSHDNPVDGGAAH